MFSFLSHLVIEMDYWIDRCLLNFLDFLFWGNYLVPSVLFDKIDLAIDPILFLFCFKSAPLTWYRLANMSEESHSNVEAMDLLRQFEDILEFDALM